MALVVVGAAFLLSCGGDGNSSSSVAERGCERDDECNFLEPGVSVSECIEQIETLLDSLTQSQRNDFVRIVNECLEFETCAAYNACLN